MRPFTPLLVLALLVPAVGAALPCVAAQGPPATTPPQGGEQFADLSDMSLEQLLDVEVTLVSRRAQRLVDAPAAVFVISRMDIERSGMSSIPELLRLVPGVQVERLNSSRWAISARGFVGQFANKLLVLVDGRSVYTPLFSGTYWDMQDLVLDDIERIEVIRGPGGVNWGANAVNGVINIKTRQAGETHGTYVQSLVGNEEHNIFSLRHGGALSPDVDYRLSGKYREVEPTHDASDHAAGDDFMSGTMALRLDGRIDDRRSWMLSAGFLTLDEFASVRSPLLTAPYSSDALEHTRGATGHLLARLQLEGEAGSRTSLQAYLDGIDRDEGGLFRERRQTLDLDLQHALAPVGGHQFTCGLGYRLTMDNVDTGPLVAATDASERNSLYSAFVRDEFWLAADHLRAAVGLRYEHNAFTGHELQPELRLSWLPGKDSLVWASVSRAVRTPGRAEDAGQLDFFAAPGPGGLTVLGQIVPDSGLRSETLWAYELGARGRLNADLVGDLSLFVQDYDDLFGYVPEAAFPTGSPPHLVLPLRVANAYAVRNYGAEASLTWQVDEQWRLVGGYAWLEQDTRRAPADAFAPTGYSDHPRHQASLRCAWNPAEHWQADAQAFYVDALQNGLVDGYLRLDLRLAWNPDDRTQLSLGVQNLLDDRHPEAAFDFGTVPSEIERAVYIQFHHHF